MLLKGKSLSLIFWILLTATIVVVSAWNYWLATEAPAQREVEQVKRNLNLHLESRVASLNWVASHPDLDLPNLPSTIDVRLVFDSQDILTYQHQIDDAPQADDLLAALVNLSNLPLQSEHGVFYWREKVLLLSVQQNNDAYSIAGAFMESWLSHIAGALSYDIRFTATYDGVADTQFGSAALTLPSIVGKPVYLQASSIHTLVTEPFPWWVAVMLSASVSGVIIFLFYYQPIWRRLQDIIEQSRSAMKSNDFKERIHCRGSDDIADMAMQINAMLSSLEYCYNLMAKTNLITTELMQKVGSDSRLALQPNQPEENELNASLNSVSRLSKALDSGDIELFLQPVFGGDRKTITGYEALARWMDVDLGMASPQDFVSLCEKSGLTDVLTKVLIEQTAKVVPKLKSKNGAHIKVSLNLSTSQFLSPVFLECLAELAKTRKDVLPNLEFEVKESTITHDFDQVELIVEKLAKLGVGVCIDDYGLGRYSLMYLQRIPVKSIKLSAAFTERLSWESAEVAFIEGIARFAGGLGIRVIVKNIETEAQLGSFRNEVPLEYQGLSLSPPAPVEAQLA